MPPKSKRAAEETQVLMYPLKDTNDEVEVLYREESIWMNQDQIARLFDIDAGEVARLIHQLYTEEGYSPIETTANMRRTSAGGKLAQYYNLEIILAVGQVAKSKRAADFRKWANRKLAEYMQKGYLLDDERLARGNKYFEELQERVRAIRTSEANFYQKVRSLFATSHDYDKNSETAREFYATVQNKFHYAVHGRTAAEMVLDRVDPEKLNMGAIIRENKPMTMKEALIAKNYLSESELRTMEKLADMFLSYADLRATGQTILTMQDWIKKLDELIRLVEYPVLVHKGTVSHDSMVAHVREMYETYKRRVMEEKMLSELQWEQLMLDAAENMLLPPADDIAAQGLSEDYVQGRFIGMGIHPDESDAEWSNIIDDDDDDETYYTDDDNTWI